MYVCTRRDTRTVNSPVAGISGIRLFGVRIETEEKHSGYYNVNRELIWEGKDRGDEY